jgi:hypothetical protein
MGVLFGLVVTFLGAAIFNVVGGVAFVPLQTLWINFTTQVFQAIGLGYGQPAEGLMKRKPRDPEQAILPTGLMIWLGFIGLVMGATTIGVIAWADDHYDTTTARTMGMTSFALANLLYRSRTGPAAIGVQPRCPARSEVPVFLSAPCCRDHHRAAARSAQQDPETVPADAAPVADLHRYCVRGRPRFRDPQGVSAATAAVTRRATVSRLRLWGHRADRWLSEQATAVEEDAGGNTRFAVLLAMQ